MYTIKVRTAEKMQVQDRGEHMLSVQFAILQDDEPVKELRHGFPLGITVKELEAELAGVLAAFVKDTETAEATAEFAAQDAQADETIEKIVGAEITG